MLYYLWICKHPLSCAPSHYAGFTGQPVSITAFLDSSVTFLCTAFESGVFWLVNDTRATDTSIVQRGIHSGVTRRIGEDTVARLTIPASASHNNTRLQCALYTEQGERLLSDEVELKVQGISFLSLSVYTASNLMNIYPPIVTCQQ